jgi:hypothetical protein
MCFYVFVLSEIGPASWSSGQGFLTTDYEVPGSIPLSAMGIFP